MAASAISSRRVAEITSFVGSAALVVFFALRGGGGYDLVARSEASVVIWVVLGAGIAVGVLPVGRWKGSGVWLLAALAALALWTALALSWTSSAERTTVELARVLFFLGVVALGLSLGDRRNRGALLGGLFLGAAVVVILALASRLFPASFPSDPVARFVGNARRLSYPFGYWNAVGCLGSMVLAAGACVSAGARPLWIRGATLAAASMAVPTIYLTYSRGAVIASLVALLAALAVTRARAVLVLHVMAVALGGAVVVLVIRGQPAIAEGTGSAGRGAVIGAAVAIACVCALVAVITGRLDLGRRRGDHLHRGDGTAVTSRSASGMGAER